MSTATFWGTSYLLNDSRAPVISSAVRPAAAAFQSDSGLMR